MKRISTALAFIVFSVIVSASLQAQEVVFKTSASDFGVPQLGCWFWGAAEYYDAGADGAKARESFLRGVASGGTFDFLTASMRFDWETPDPRLSELAKQACAEAEKAGGIKLLLDLDIRMTRRAFEKKYPDLRQESLHFAESPLSAADDSTANISASLTFQASQLTDHYTGRTVPYLVRSQRLVRVWAGQKDENGAILPATLRVVPDSAIQVTAENQDGKEARLTATVTLPKDADSSDTPTFIAGAVAFGYLYPDVFAPELISFEREIIALYACVPLVGTWKDEWGFPPCSAPENARNQFWFSENMACAYRAKTNRDLVEDLFLTWTPQTGRDEERTRQIDVYNALCRDRHVEIESEYIKASREVFGPNSFAAVHPTWWPWPEEQEFKKNALDWWRVPRDFAQTDEMTPYPCRNALAKRTGRAWINMFYASTPEPYLSEHWGAVLSGGRVNIHPLYPLSDEAKSALEPFCGPMTSILNAGVAEARQKIHLVDFISQAPVNSPVAVVFGDFGAMNKTRPEWNRVGSDGIALCDALLRRGIVVDMIPASEAEAPNSPWKTDAQGRLCYGIQPYETVVFFGENPSDAHNFAALRSLAGEKSPTMIESFPIRATEEETDAFAQRLTDVLIARGVRPVTGWSNSVNWGTRSVLIPPRTGYAEMTDGTRIWTQASDAASGDRLVLDDLEIRLDGVNYRISVVATGLFAIRTDENGELIGIAAGGLVSVTSEGIDWMMMARQMYSGMISEGKDLNIAARKTTNGNWEVTQTPTL